MKFEGQMQFTEKEITYAKQLKKYGLEWKPGFGDICLFHNDLMIVWYFVGKFIVCIPQEIEYGIDGKGEYIHQSHYNLVPGDVTWLPLFHQCREILSKADMEISLVDNKKTVMLTLWKRNWGQNTDNRYLEIVTQIKADTDLEAMYQALLWVLNEPAASLNEQAVPGFPARHKGRRQK